ncbi:hypothetical protein [Actinomadura fibrosa]|uniref:ABC transporter permease n=1 Tax=Actinomadura fibrosa TaxID=111802 RepID=A0ABW2XAF1_9ACTN|nr:hypothetical protein [Actinomadura fibrosa]
MTAVQAPPAARATRGPVPRWADWTAQATMWCVVPSGIWRILFGLGLPMGFTGSQDPENGPWFVLPYVIALTAFSEAVAFLGMGLVRPWGEVWPQWVPFLRGRTVHPLAAIIPAALGSVALILLWTSFVFAAFQADPDPEMPHGAKAVLLYVCYLPLVAWGPLLAAVTVAYAVRRRRYG